MLGDVKRGTWAQKPGLLLANSQDGVIRVQTLEALRVPAYTTYRRCLPDGPWRRVLPGVVSLSTGPVSRAQQVSAALLYGGEGALLTGAEACRRHGIRESIDDVSVHVLIPAARKRLSSGFVVVERTERMPGPVIRGGVPLAPLPRALLDASRRLSTFDPCRALLAEALQRGLATHAELDSELSQGSNRGSAIPRKVVAELADGAHSVAEIDGQTIWARAGLPPARWNGRLFTRDGSYIATPDAWCVEVALAWEIDSATHHGDPAGFARTLARNARYAAAGVLVLQTLPARLRTEPATVIKELRAAYAAAAARQRPDVEFRPRA